MSFDLSSCRKKFEDLSGVIQWGETINNGTEEIFRIFVRDLSGNKADYDKIVKDDIEPYFTELRSYSYEKERHNGSVFGVTCARKN
jgi:hypothetical protein